MKALIASTALAATLGLAACSEPQEGEGSAAQRDGIVAAATHDAMAENVDGLEEISYEEFVEAVAAFEDPAASGYTKLHATGHEHDMGIGQIDGTPKLQTHEVAIDETKTVSFEGGALVVDGKTMGDMAAFMSGEGTMVDAILSLGPMTEEVARSFGEDPTGMDGAFKFCRKGDLVGMTGLYWGSEGFEFEKDGVTMKSSGTFDQMHLYNSYGMLAYGRLSKGAVYEVSKDGQALGTHPADFEFSIAYE